MKTQTKKHILMLNYEFPPLGGGAGNATYYILKEFSKPKYKDLEIDLITSSTDKFNIQRFSKNITIHFLDINKKGNLHYQSNKDLLNYSWKAYNYSKHLINKRKKENTQYNLCHAFFGIPCGYIALKLKNKYNLPYIVSLRGSDVPGHNPKFALLDKLIFKRLSKKIWKEAYKVIANSNDLIYEAKKTKEDCNFAVIPNGIDTKFYKKINIKRNKYKNNLILLYVGRLSKVKGLDYLLKAISNLDSLELWLVGDGDQKNHLEELSNKLKIRQKVKFLGIKDKKELLQIYNTSDIFILPSLNEGMSNSILEAMACGLPIITTDTGGSKELIKGNGFIISKASPEALRQAINKFLINPNLIKSMSNISRLLAERMSWGNVADDYWGEYEKC